MLTKEPSSYLSPLIKTVYRPNERVKFSDIWIKEQFGKHKGPLPLTKPRNSSRQTTPQRKQAQLRNQSQLSHRRSL